MIPLEKFHSYGNDFLVIESRYLSEDNYASFSRAVCKPHFGVGAEGCVVLEKKSGQEFGIRIFNQDGSEAGMSGNGVRCAAAYVHRQEVVESGEIRFLTTSGQKSYRILEAQPPVWKYVSTLGVPSFVPKDIPIRLSEGRRSGHQYELTVGERTIMVTPLHVGNPQCVVFVESLPKTSEFELLGKALERHSFFPERTNVSFVKVMNAQEIAIRIWERGVGPTHSSGTGSSGAGVASILLGKVSSPLKVSTETGTQLVEWEPPGQVTLTGEARFVAEIQFHWP
jgi:diaminopimelate epimerase